MNKEVVVKLLLEPNGSEKLAKTEEALPICLGIVAEGEPLEAIGPALSYLVRISRTKAGKKAVEEGLTSRRIKELLKDPSPKVRKNTARLLSQITVPGSDTALIEALKAEDIRLVRPSLLLALGKDPSPKALAFLEAYQVEAPGEGEEKHAAAEEEALKKALDQPGRTQKHHFTGFSEGTRLRLICARGLEEALESEILEKHAGKILGRGKGFVNVQVTASRRILSVRCAQEILVPLTGTEITKAAAEAERVLASSLELTNENTVGFRLEMKNDREEVKTLAAAVEKKSSGVVKFVNRPSDYEVELRAISKEGPFFLKFWNTEDRRFEYRAQAIPASIHPSNAAGLIRLTSMVMRKMGQKKGNARVRVLDPCCGSGTLLYERLILAAERKEELPVSIGIDIEKRALDAASENADALENILFQKKAGPLSAAFLEHEIPKEKIPIRLLQGDLQNFHPKDSAGNAILFDEIYANLPFGIRVGDHEENIKMYPALVEALPTWLAKEGTAILYTMEGTLLKRLVLRSPELKIIKELQIEAGGLEPKAFIIQKRPGS